MTILFTAALFLLVFFVNAVFFIRFMCGEDNKIDAVMGCVVSFCIGLVACAFADNLGLSASTSVFTTGAAFLAGIVAAIGFELACRKVFKNLHQLT